MEEALDEIGALD